MRILQWVLDNLFAVLIIAGVLAQLLQSMRKGRGEGGEAGPTVEPPKEYEFEDPDLAERTRRIREDIHRRIAQRQAGGAPATGPAADEDLAPEPSAFGEPPAVREVVVVPPAPVTAAQARLDAQRHAEILEQQAAMADRMRHLAEMKSGAQRRAAFEASTVPELTVERRKARAALIGEIRDPAALRRAFVLREVLGPPVGLR